jgi:hypothetical protein
MKRSTITGILLLFCSACIARNQPLREVPGNTKDASGVAIVTLDGPTVTGEILTWRYQIHNGSTQDVWICESSESAPYEAHLAEDNETLLVERRLDRPNESSSSGEQPYGEYVRLRGGESRTELMSFPLPVQPQYYLSDPREEHTLEYARRVTLKIGYYAGDLPGMILEMLRQEEMHPQAEYSLDTPREKRSVSYWLGGRLTFLQCNDNAFYDDMSFNRSEWVTIPYTFQALKGEQVLRIDAGGLRIPYLEGSRPTPYPNLENCTRIEIKFNESALGFFFPCVSDQNLLNPAERQYLQSLGAIPIEDRRTLGSLANEVSESVCDAFVPDHGTAELTCYRDDERLMSLTMYDCSYIIDGKGQVFRHLNRFPSLRALTPQVRALDLRAQCASRLENLWYRLRTHHKNKTYPPPKTWCDDILISPKKGVGRQDVFIPSFRCPNQEARGKCHYAMNPSCSYSSPADVVLLSEAKDGWNQHGGPELFTFDNHDPKGGLVLLNDGTVKFIRTDEELKQLRWK